MAKVIQHEFKNTNKNDWSELANGEEHIFAQGKDFTCKRKSFISGLYQYASIHNMKCHVKRIGEYGVSFRFEDKS